MLKILAVVWVSLMASLTPIAAALVITFEQDGADVVVTASGTLDLSGVTDYIEIGGTESITFARGGVGDSLMNVVPGDDSYFIDFGRPLFGADFDIIQAASVSGDSFGLYSNGSTLLLLYVPNGFTSGLLSGSMRFSNTTVEIFHPIGQTISWGNSPDQAVIFAPGPSVPEPSSGLLTLLGVGALLIRRQRGDQPSYTRPPVRPPLFH